METKADFVDGMFATDSGPECPRCKQTLWLYRVETSIILGERVDIKAQCACCHHMHEFTLPTSCPAPRTIQGVKHLHQSAMSCDKVSEGPNWFF